MEPIEQALEEIRALHEQLTNQPAPEITPQMFQPFPPGIDPVSYAIQEVVQLRQAVQRTDEPPRDGTAEETLYHKNVKGKELIAHIPQDFNKETLCNILDLKRVLQNLIVNAGYASRKGGKIDVYLEDLKDGIKISVEDHGLGIPDDVKALLLKEKYSSKPDGNGFGLMSCKEIIEEYHGGKLSFDSELGKGSTFYFKIPN